ncbi:carbohydrate ABC transporter permease [Aestuariivirga sp.]|uniref:carbohydrate ABC transporter permease n=1 Tax=Aestuariivirga sp. TaxID=2650926 RepID=UPI0039E54B40
MNRGHRLRGSLLWAAAAVVALLLVLPIVYLASVSLKSPDDVLSGHFFPASLNWQNWPAAFAVAPLRLYITNSVLASLLSGLVTLAITLPAVFAIYRLEIARTWLPQLVLGSFLAPPVVAMLPLFYLLKFIGLINTVPGLALIYGLMNVPVALWLLAPFVAQVPREIEEAARLDGANTFGTFRHVVLPLVSHGAAATYLIVVILAYNEFLLASALTFNEGARTLTVGISLFQGERLQNFGQMAAASLAGVIPIYVLALIAQRWLVDGLTAGSVKG